MKDKLENKTVQLQTKVSSEVYARLESICKKYGYSIFQLLRMLSDCIVRFMDDKHNLSEDLVRIMRMFENIPGWKNSICLAEGIDEMEIVEAIYIMRKRGDNGYRMVMVERPMMVGDQDGWQCTYNVQRIFERFVEVTNPSLYRQLRMVAAEMEIDSMYDLVSRLSNLYHDNPDDVELRKQFESIDWHRGAQIHNTTQYVRHNNHSADYIEMVRETTLFD
jgi:hypothetical protein